MNLEQLSLGELLGLRWTELGVQAGLKLLQAVLILLLARLLAGILSRLASALETRLAGGAEVTDRSQRVRTLVKLTRQAGAILVWSIAMMAILDLLGIDIRPILAGAGVVGLAVGFGAQNLVRDFVSGLFIILEDQVNVGDVATINGTGGLVEAVNLRTIVLRDVEGTVHVFPNGTITTLANLSKGWSAAVLDVGVAYKEDVDEVIEVMRQVAAELRSDGDFGAMVLEDIEIFGLDRFEESSLVIKCRIKTKPLQQWSVAREYRRRLKKAFDAEGIEIPFPNRVVRLEGAAPGKGTP